MIPTADINEELISLSWSPQELPELHVIEGHVQSVWDESIVQSASCTTTSELKKQIFNATQATSLTLRSLPTLISPSYLPLGTSFGAFCGYRVSLL